MNRPGRYGWRRLLAQFILIALSWVVYYRVIVPLHPDGNVLGIVIVIVLSVGILAVPVVSALHRRKQRDGER